MEMELHAYVLCAMWRIYHGVQIELPSGNAYDSMIWLVLSGAGEKKRM